MSVIEMFEGFIKINCQTCMARWVLFALCEQFIWLFCCGFTVFSGSPRMNRRKMDFFSVFCFFCIVLLYSLAERIVEEVLGMNQKAANASTIARDDFKTSQVLGVSVFQITKQETNKCEFKQNHRQPEPKQKQSTLNLFPFYRLNLASISFNFFFFLFPRKNKLD